MFDAIVLSNGWGDATAALQLLSHLQDECGVINTDAPPAPPPVRTPDVAPLEKLTQLLMSETVKREPAPPTPVEPTGLEALPHTYFTGQQSSGLGPRFRQVRRNWSDVCLFVGV